MAVGATWEVFVGIGVTRIVGVAARVGAAVGVAVLEASARWYNPKTLVKPIRPAPTPEVSTAPTLRRAENIFDQSNQPLHIGLYVQFSTRYTSAERQSPTSH